MNSIVLEEASVFFSYQVCDVFSRWENLSKLKLVVALITSAVVLWSSWIHKVMKDGEKVCYLGEQKEFLACNWKLVVNLKQWMSVLKTFQALPCYWKYISVLALWKVCLNLCLKFLKCLLGRVMHKATLTSIFICACWKSNEKIFYSSKLFCFMVLLFAVWKLVVSTCICKSLFKGWLLWAESWQARSQP